MYSVLNFSVLYLPPQLSVSYSSPKLNGANILSPSVRPLNYDLFLRCFSQSMLYSTRSALFPGGVSAGGAGRSSPPSALSLPKCSSRGMLYSTRSALFLIVFLESKVVKSMISTPICDRPSRAPPPNAHIWPRLALEKGSKSAFFNGEVVAQGSLKLPWRTPVPRGTGVPKLAQCGFSRYCAHRRDDSPMSPQSGTDPASSRKSPRSSRVAHVCETTRRSHPFFLFPMNYSLFPLSPSYFPIPPRCIILARQENNE